MNKTKNIFLKTIPLGILLLTLTSLISHAEEIRWDDLVEAVIQVESGGNPHSVSRAGAIGLMQITPIVLKEFSESPYYIFQEEMLPHQKCKVTDLYCPYINIRIGTWYLHRLHTHYNCDTIEKILHAWNGGITRLRKVNYDCSKMPRESQEFTKKVLKLYEKKREVE